jgi:hypothetical protein
MRLSIGASRSESADLFNISLIVVQADSVPLSIDEHVTFGVLGCETSRCGAALA